MSHLPLRAGAATMLLLLSPPARPNCCVFEDPLLGVSEVAARGGGLRLALETEHLSSSAAMDGMPGSRMEIRQTSVRAIAVYNALERLNLVLLVPFARREWRTPDDGGSLSGVGDMDVSARISLWRRVEFVASEVDFAKTRVQAVALSAGTSLPTGNDEATWRGVRLAQDAQIGTGAFGPYAGLLYRVQEAPWDLFVNATARVRTENGFGYRSGSALYLGAEVQYRVFSRVALALGVDGRLAGRDTERAVPVMSSGGFVLSAVPGAYVDVGEGFWARARVQIPAYASLGGDQEIGPVFVAGLQYEIR